MAVINTADNPLGVESLLAMMAASLPKRPGPQIKNPYAAIALAVHACMVAVGFRLKGLGEDHRIGQRPECSRTSNRIDVLVEAQSAATNPRPLPTEWDDSASFAFR